MPTLIETLKNQNSSYLYRIGLEINIDELLLACKSNHWQGFSVDGKVITNKITFLETWSKAMNFPDYFGYNWDAFDDCLLDLQWCDLTPRLVIYRQPENFAHQNPPEWDVVMDVLQIAVEYWQPTDTPLYIIFQTEDPLFYAIASLIAS